MIKGAYQAFHLIAAGFGGVGDRDSLPKIVRIVRYLQPKAFCRKSAAFFLSLEKYLEPPDPRTLEFLCKTFPDPETRSKVIQFRKEVFARFIFFVTRQAAYSGNRYQLQRQRQFLHAAGVKLSPIVNKREIVAQLQALGGKKARLHAQSIREKNGYLFGSRLYQSGILSWKIEKEIRSLKALLKIYESNHLLDVEQSYWHYLMVVCYTCLPAYGLTSKRRSYIRPLCNWLSMPEIGLRCTPNTIKAAFTRTQDKGKFNQFIRASLTKTRSGIFIDYRPGHPMSPSEALKRTAS
jgi:hypothetical protein